MKRILLFASLALFGSCATHKYGCGLSSNQSIEVKHTVLNGQHYTDSFLVTTWYHGVTKYVDRKLINYKPVYTTCRGYGKVVVVDTFVHPYSYCIKINSGVIIKNDTAPANIKYLIVKEGDFFNSLTPLINKETRFETKLMFPDIFDSEEMQTAVEGKVHPNIDNFILVNYKEK